MPTKPATGWTVSSPPPGPARSVSVMKKSDPGAKISSRPFRPALTADADAVTRGSVRDSQVASP